MTGSIKFEKPALALKCGQVLKKLMCLKEGWAIRNKLKEEKEEASDLLKLYHAEWTEKVNSHAFETLRERKYNKVELLPITEDLKKLTVYQESKMKLLSEELKANPTAQLWKKLALVTLGRISYFNKRREAEVGQVPLDVYLKMVKEPESVPNADIMQGLTKFERMLCSRLRHFEVIGKQNRKVPIVLTENMVQALDVLVFYRNCTVNHDSNPFLFANAGNSHLRTGDALKLAAREAGLVHPELITSTKLRKYMATVSQVVSLTENELEYLANHMGHNINVHRKFYRLQDSTVELAKVSRLLIAAENGDLGTFAGKQLDDITFDDLPDYSEKCPRDCPDSVHNTYEETDSSSLTYETIVTKEPAFIDCPDSMDYTESSPQTSQTTAAKEPAFIDDISNIVKSSSKKKKKEKAAVIRTSWSKREMNAINNLVDMSVTTRKPPTKQMICKCIEENKELENRTWANVKFRVWAEAQKLMKKKNVLRKSLFT